VHGTTWGTKAIWLKLEICHYQMTRFVTELRHMKKDIEIVLKGQKPFGI
jgi:hypothetical protein